MASVSRRGDRWRARFRLWPGGPQRSKTFPTKREAEAWLVEQQHALARGSYVDQRAGRVTVAEYATSWTARRTWRPATRRRVEGDLRRWILPAFGTWPLGQVRRGHVETWVAGLPLAPSTARTVATVLRGLFSAAVDDELVARNPCTGARMPTVERPPVVPLTVEQIRAVIHHAPEHLRAAIVLGAGTGVRQGEAMGVTLDRVDWLGRTLRIDRQLLSPPHVRPLFGPPKTRRGYRTIALSTTVLDALSAHLAAFGSGPDGHLFHEDGRPIGSSRLARHMQRATTAAGVEATWHDLRHHHASVLLSAGVSPALVAERLGHTIGELMLHYAHVIRSDEDRVRALVDETLGSAEAILRPRAL